VLLVLHPKYELKEAQLFGREITVFWKFSVASMWLKFYFYMKSTMVAVWLQLCVVIILVNCLGFLLV
jgi:hypothetical protein